MKIAHVRVDEGFGGLARFILALLEGFRERAGQVDHLVIPMRTPGELGRRAREAGYPVIHFPMPTRLDITARSRMKRILESEKPDLVCTYCVRSDVVAGVVAAQLGIPWVSQVANPKGEYTNPLFGKILLSADARALRKASAVITLSNEGVALLKRRVPGARILRIPNGIETRLAPASPDRSAFNIPKDALAVGALGRLYPVKGYDVLVRAAAEVLKQVPSAFFVIAGEGPEKETLESLISELGIGERFGLAGFVKDIRPFLASLDLFCMPSRTEGHPFALLEAMAARRPVVASDVGGIPELVRDGNEALLVPAEEPSRLAGALIELLSSPDRRATMAESARRRVEEEFSFEGMVDAYLSLYGEILNASLVGGPA